MLSEDIRKKAADKGVKISPPWVEVAREITALFVGDPDVIVEYDNDAMVTTILVEDAIKADAIDRLIRHEFTFGNVTMTVKVVPANDSDGNASLVRHMFAGNEAVSEIMTHDSPVGPETFVMFVPDVVQYFNDNLASPYGVTSVLLEDVARDVLDVNGVSFATDILEDSFDDYDDFD